MLTAVIPPWHPLTGSDLVLVEQAYKFRFPPAFHALLDDQPAALRRMFPRGRFTTVHDMRSFRKTEPRLLPFLVDEQPEHQDFHCFDLATPADDPRVVVFAVHTTVADWPNLSAWLAWVEARAPKE
jgi:hypothetical protein